jgi:MoaA/NifB/PqqE/SkfB family radical SAM enzyme
MKSLLHRKKMTNAFNIFRAIEIETSTACNRRCSYCPNSKFDKGLYKNQRFMDARLFHKIINDLAGMRFKGRISPHFYNEPLLDKRLPGFIRYAREKLPCAEISIFTNGDFLDLDLFYRLIGYRTVFYITQHSNNLPRKLSLLLRRLRAHYDKNVIWGRMIHPNIGYRRFTPQTPLMNRGGLVRSKTVGKKVECSTLYQNGMTVDYKGNAILCCNDYFSSVILGNLRKESVAAIWNSRRYAQIRSDLSRGIFGLDICKKCVGIRDGIAHESFWPTDNESNP